MTLASAWQTRANWNWNLLSELVSSSVRRTLRMTSGLILFIYIGAHLTNHALGLISLDTAERGMEIAVEVWYSVPGTLLLYGAAATHFVLALWAVYERRTFRLPPLELLRIALGFTLPIILIGHAANTRLAYELFGLSSGGYELVGGRSTGIAARPARAGMAAWLSWPEFRIQAAAAVSPIAVCAVRHRAAAAGVFGARVHRHGARAVHQSGSRGGGAGIFGSGARGRTHGD